MFTRENLPALALGIAEYDSALAHLDALDQVPGHNVPHGIRGRIADELAYLALQWSNAHGEALFIREVDVPRAVAEARTYCTENQSAIDDLTTDTH